MTSILRAGRKTLANKYRSISLKSILCKVVERIICESIVKCLHENRQFHDAQRGLRVDKSYRTNLLPTMDNVARLPHESEEVDLCFIYFS